MKYRSSSTPLSRRKWLCAFLAALAILRHQRLLANPAGLTVGTGHATTQQTGSQLNVTVGQLAILNWQSFNISAGQTTSFLQPSANSVVLNVIGGASPSQIFGGLKGNGTVILENSSGFYFGPNSMVKVGGSFIATTAPLAPDFGSGAAWQFSGLPPLAGIVNYGQIEVGTGKSLFLIAENIGNHGRLVAPQGSVDLAAGQSVLVSESPDGRGLSAKVTLPQGSVNNLGQIVADGGSILMQASTVNQGGLLQADSIQNKNGVIELVAADQLNLGAASQILAQGGDSAGGSAGGAVTLKSDNSFSDAIGSKIVTTGGSQGGNGGNVEISAPEVQSLNSAIDARASAGGTAGKLLLDPDNIVLGTSGSGSAGTGTVLAGGTTGTLNLNVNTAFASLAVSQIILQATDDITLAAGTTWNLSKTIGSSLGGVTAGNLTLEAGQDIVFGSNSKVTDANGWSVSLAAGYNFNNGPIINGTGNIYLNGSSGGTGSGSIQTAAGNVNLAAGNGIQIGSGSVGTSGGDVTWQAGGNIVFGTSAKITTLGNGAVTLEAGYNFSSGAVQSGSSSIDVGGLAQSQGIYSGGGSIQTAAGDIDLTAAGSVLVGAGFVRSVAGGTTGGNIDVTALSGNISVGTKGGNIGYYGAIGTPWGVEQNLGGISTMAGGSVTLDAVAGSINPTSSSNPNFGVSGAFGSQPGNVTLIAGAGILGTFNVANGVGTILAGLSLPDGTPSIQNSAANVGSSQVPVTLQLAAGSWNVWAGNNIYINEVRNPAAVSDSVDSYPSTYAPNAAVNLWAGDGIALVGGNLLDPASTTTVGPVYAPQLSLNAGAGGITVDNQVNLFASSAGSLSLITRAGGDLVAENSDPTTVLGITMLDSGPTAAPLHENDPTPVTVDISGSIYNFDLVVPTFANINVVGNAYNFGFSGQNLSASPAPENTTSINLGQTAEVNLETAGVLNPSTDGGLPVGGNLVYADALHSGSVALADPIPAAVLNSTKLLGALATSVLSYDPATGQFSITGQMPQQALNDLLDPSLGLDAAQRGAVLALYAESQKVNEVDLAGPGNLNITANSINLGASDGIKVDFPYVPNSPLFAISPYGANLNITTAGDLDLTSSAIADGGLGGNISLSVGGALDVGGTATSLGDQSAPKGVFTTSGGNIVVTANGDVNVDSSRIAAFDGGDVKITSLTGDVNAGAGGQGLVNFTGGQLDPATGAVVPVLGYIPLSGILATTLVGSDASLGNIIINTPKGSVNGSLGGIFQIAFGTADTSKNFIEVTAGKDIDLPDSGVIGSDIQLKAGGSIDATVVGTSVSATAVQNVNVIAVSTGNVSISAGGSVSGTIVGGGDVNVSGSSIDATVRGGSVSTSGDTSGATLGTPAPAAAQTLQVADNADNVGTKTNSVSGDEFKKNKGIVLAQKSSRVTVLLPPNK